MDFKVKRILVTGAAGFIGSTLCQRLLELAEVCTYSIEVIGVDNMNDYYDVNLKKARVKKLQKNQMFTFIKGDIADKELITETFREYQPHIVVNLAAQAGVRYSISNPDAYIQANIIGFYNILEACRLYPVEHLVYASSSSVYGANRKIPFSTEDKTESPRSLYAATKKANELFAYAYSDLYDIPSTGLRFFTVYGPAGRPDMAYFDFTNKLLAGQTIRIFNYGKCQRDFTYIDDAVTGVIKIIQEIPAANKEGVRHKVYNIGNNRPENLMDLVDALQQELIRAGALPADYDFEAHRELLPMQPGDVETTYADIDELAEDFGFRPSTSLKDGIRKFVEWYMEFYAQKSWGKADV